MSFVLVNVGDTIEKDQPVVELETDKATVEVPSSVAGVVKDIRVKQGDKGKVGDTILSVEESGAGAGKPAASEAWSPEAAPPEATAPAVVERESKQPDEEPAAPRPERPAAKARSESGLDAEAWASGACARAGGRHAKAQSSGFRPERDRPRRPPGRAATCA